MVTLITVWGSYGFRVGRMADLPSTFSSYGAFPTSGWSAVIGQWRIPAHEFVHGLLFLSAHTAAGHRSLMFGEFSQRGFLYYYPVVLAMKTPLPFILFAIVGCAALFRRRLIARAPWARGLAVGAVGLLAMAITSPINIGVRHVIVLYPLLAIAAAYGWVRWSESSRHRRPIVAVSAALIAAQTVLLVNAVPYQSSYYNAFAGSEPAHVSSDSDFDWGQDALALEAYFKAHPVANLQLQLQGTVNPCKLDLPPFTALRTPPAAGWIAVSERVYRLNYRRGHRTDTGRIDGEYKSQQVHKVGSQWHEGHGAQSNDRRRHWHLDGRGHGWQGREGRHERALDGRLCTGGRYVEVRRVAVYDDQEMSRRRAWR